MDVAYTAEGDLYVSWAEDVELWSSETGETLNFVLTTGFGTSAFIGTSPDGTAWSSPARPCRPSGAGAERWLRRVQRFGSSGDFPLSSPPTVPAC